MEFANSTMRAIGKIAIDKTTTARKWFRQNDARRLRQELRRDADAGPSSAGVVPRCLAEE
jgi:hypothetical protein